MRICSIDIGTTGTKVIVFNETGTNISMAFKEYPVICTHRDWAEQDAEYVWQIILELMEQCLSAKGICSVDAIVLSVQGDAIIPVGGSGNALMPAILGMDNRSEKQALWCDKQLGTYNVFSKTGMRPHAINSATKIMWIQETCPDIADKTERFLTYDSFILKRLGSEGYITDITMASRSMMYEREKNEWSDFILSELHIDKLKLPAIVPSGTIVGRLKQSIVQSLHLNKAPYLIAGGHDQVCAAVGAGAVVPGIAVDSHGTAEVLSTSFGEEFNAGEMCEAFYPCYRHAVEGQNFTFALNHSGGIVFRWFRDKLAEREVEAARAAECSAYDMIVDGMGDCPSDLLFLPHFNGSGTPYCALSNRGSILGLSFRTSREDIARALLEGLAMEMRLNMEKMRQIGIDLHDIRCVGGGASHPKILQLKADVYGKSVSVMENKESASLGAAIIALTGMGVFKTVEDGVKALVKVKDIFVPGKENAENYAQKFKHYCEFYQALRPVYRLWK